MCKTYPGKRCASHTRAALRAAEEKYDEKMREVLLAEQSVSVLEYDGQVNSEEYHQARSALSLALSEAAALYLQREDARDYHDATRSGMKELREQIELAPTQAHRDALLARLARAEDLAEAQKNGAELQRSADEALLGAEGEAAEFFDGLERKMVDSRMLLAQKEEELASYAGALAKLDREHGAGRWRLKQEAKELDHYHRDIHRAVREAYIAAGVSPENAEHYAIDTVNSLQSNKWGYIGADSVTDRVPLYSADLRVKVKGSGHEDHVSTEAAAEALVSDAKFQELLGRYRESVAQYTTAYQEARTSGIARAELGRAETSARAAVGDLRQSYATAKRERDITLANFTSSAAVEGEHYRVTPKQFVSSLYEQPGGGTNAFVLFAYEDHAPMWVRVRSVSKVRGEPRFLLDNGMRLESAELAEGALLLRRPEEGATRAKLTSLG